MKFSANISLLYSELAFLGRFEAAAKDGFKAVEIQFPYDYPPELLKAKLDQHQLKCVLINVPAGDLMAGGLGLACRPEKRQDYQQALKQCLEYVEILEPECVNVLSGRCESQSEEEACFETLIDNLSLTQRALSPYAVTTTVEAINHYDMPHFFVSTFEQMRTLVEQCGTPSVKMQFDIYHMVKMGEAVAEQLAESITQIAHIQFADDVAREEPGTGNIDFDGLFRLIDQLGYSGWLGAEYRPSKDNTSETLGWFKQSSHSC